MYNYTAIINSNILFNVSLGILLYSFAIRFPSKSITLNCFIVSKFFIGFI